MSGRPRTLLVFFLPRVLFAISTIVFLALAHILLAKAVKVSKPFPPDRLVIPELFLFIVNVLASWLQHATYESREYILSYGMYGDGVAGNGIENRKSSSRRRALLSFVFNVVLDIVSFAILAAASSWFAKNEYAGAPWWINLACCVIMAVGLSMDLRSLWIVYRSHTRMRRRVQRIENAEASDEEISLYSDEEDQQPSGPEEEQPVLSEEGQANVYEGDSEEVS